MGGAVGEEVNVPLVLCYVKSCIVDKAVGVGKHFTVGLFGQQVEFVVEAVEPAPMEG